MSQKTWNSTSTEEIIIPKFDVTIYVHKEHPEAIIPEVAYNGTSAAFDLTCITTTIIPAHTSAMVPNGLNITIDQQDLYSMQIQLRSSKGIKYDLIPHYGLVDAGYTGPCAVKVYNVGDKDVVIEKGERYAQISVHHKPTYQLIELDDMQFEALKQCQLRGDGGIGSSGK